MRLPEEGGEVGRDGVAELHGLLSAILCQELTILGKRTQSERPQAPRQPAVNQLALLVGQVDAGDALDEYPQRSEILVAEGEFAQAVHRLRVPQRRQLVHARYLRTARCCLDPPRRPAGWPDGGCWPGWSRCPALA